MKYLVLIDRVGQGFLKLSLKYLDAKLAGGGYFRKAESFSKIVGKHLKIIESGTFVANNFFYKYPYVVARK